MKTVLKNKKAVLAAAAAALVVIAIIIFCAVQGIGVFDRSGWVTDETGVRRYLDQRGDALTGWHEVDGAERFFDTATYGGLHTGWLLTAEGTLYLDEGGVKTTGWQAIDGKRYHFTDTGIMETGWLEQRGERYLLGADGAMQTGWTEADGLRYFFADSGAMQTGWLELDGQHYYLADNGVMQSGWMDLSGERFCFDSEGAMYVGWTQVDGARYYFREDGTMARGLTETEAGLIYLSAEGTVVSGWTQTEDGLRYVNEDGFLRIGWLDEGGLRYWFDENGLMHTGWLELDGERYYFHEDGVMAVGEVEIDGVRTYFTSAGKHFLLVNPWNYVPEGYTTETVSFDGYLIGAICEEPLTQLKEAVLAAGLSFNLTSGYRTHEYQTSLFQTKVNKLMGQGYSYSAAYSETSRSIAIPGTSEHQLGLAVDIKSGYKVYDWLGEHSWEYGFIVRYPDGDTKLTGIYYEPWHLRYVGVELAKEIYDLDMCVEAYMNMLTKEQAALRAK